MSGRKSSNEGRKVSGRGPRGRADNNLLGTSAPAPGEPHNSSSGPQSASRPSRSAQAENVRRRVERGPSGQPVMSNFGPPPYPRNTNSNQQQSIGRAASNTEQSEHPAPATSTGWSAVNRQPGNQRRPPEYQAPDYPRLVNLNDGSNVNQGRAAVGFHAQNVYKAVQLVEDQLRARSARPAIPRRTNNYDPAPFEDRIPQGYARYNGTADDGATTRPSNSNDLRSSIPQKRPARDSPLTIRPAKRERQATVQDSEEDVEYPSLTFAKDDAMLDVGGDIETASEYEQDETEGNQEDMLDEGEAGVEGEPIDLTEMLDDQESDIDEPPAAPMPEEEDEPLAAPMPEEEEEDLYNSTPPHTARHDRYVRVYEINAAIGLMIEALEQGRRGLLNQTFDRPGFNRANAHDDNDDDDDDHQDNNARVVLEDGVLRRATDPNHAAAGGPFPIYGLNRAQDEPQPDEPLPDQPAEQDQDTTMPDQPATTDTDATKKVGGAHRPYSWEETRAMYDIWGDEEYREASHDERAAAVDALLRSRGFHNFPQRGGNAQRIEWRQLENEVNFTRADLEASRMGRSVYVRNMQRQQAAEEKKAAAAKKGGNKK